MSFKKSKKYGTYFGKLVNSDKVNEDFHYNYNWNKEDTEKIIKKFKEPINYQLNVLCHDILKSII